MGAERVLNNDIQELWFEKSGKQLQLPRMIAAWTFARCAAPVVMCESRIEWLCDVAELWICTHRCT